MIFFRVRKTKSLKLYFFYLESIEKNGIEEAKNF